MNGNVPFMHFIPLGPQTFKDHISLIKANEGKNCQLCKQAVIGSEEHLQKKHFKNAVHFKDGVFDLFTVPCFCDKIEQLKRSHWHCFKCDRILHRRNAFEDHLQKHVEILVHKVNVTLIKLIKSETVNVISFVGEPKKDSENATSAPVSEQSILCCHCSSSFTTAGSLRRHEKEFHATSDPVYCVDLQQGVFFTAKNSRGQRVPIHVQKSTTSQVIACEVPECREFMTLAKLGGKPGAECEHLLRVSSAPPYVPPEPLREESLKMMHEKGLISTQRMTECIENHNQASVEGICSVFPVFYEKHGYSGRFVYFSIYTGRMERWSLFRRTRVSFDKVVGHWYCLCKSTKKQYRCLHIYMAMWWLYQEREDLLLECSRADSDLSGDPSENEELELDVGKGLQKHQLVAMTNYLWQNKRIPENLPQELRTQAMEVPKMFEPTEKTCPYCPGPTPPGLAEPVVVTKNASVYDIHSVKRGLYINFKKCIHL
ncbi:hypothetical protein ABG768_018737 [Culter alburnus]|uniref:C2H2-type domain-containing protein n=1 Tax=Culter alburnus TaxID=194366 RepID=A0AAW2AVI3_CULAL